MQTDAQQFIEQLYIQYAEQLERLCFHYVGFSSEYQDLIDDSIQTAFIQAWKDYKHLKDHPCIEGWLTQTCINRLRSSLATYRRRRQHHAELTEAVIAVTPDQAIDLLEDLVTKEADTEMLQRIMTALNSREQSLIHKHLVDGYSLEEIASMEQTTLSAEKSVLARVRAKARKVRQAAEKNFIFFASFLH